MTLGSGEADRGCHRRCRMAHAQLEKLEAEGKLDETLRYEILNGELVIRGLPLTRHERATSAR